MVQDRDKLAMLLDPRTLVALTKCGVDEEEKKEAMAMLEATYVAYAKKTLMHRRSLILQQQQPMPTNGPKEVEPDENDDLGLDKISDDEDAGDKTVHAPGAVAEVEGDDTVLKKEFRKCYKAYKKHCAKIKFKSLFPKVVEKAPGGIVDFPFDFAMVDMSGIMQEILDLNKVDNAFGFLPKMATASRGCVGALLASSFCERINSTANLVCTNGNSLLCPDEINMLVVLRMNEGFMEYMFHRHKGDAFAKHCAPLTTADAKEEEESDEDEAVEQSAWL